VLLTLVAGEPKVVTRGTLFGKYVLTLIWMIIIGGSFKIILNWTFLTLNWCRGSMQLESHQAACVGCPIKKFVGDGGSSGTGARGKRVHEGQARDRPSNPAPKRGGVMKGIFKFCCFCCASA